MLFFNNIFVAFTISGVVCHADGTNALIMVSCEVSLDELHTAVGEKLDRFPGLIALQYWLASDNAKAGAISIQTDDELQLFKDCLRSLSIPQLLASRKPSTRVLKPVLVYFEDTSMESKSSVSNSSSHKVCILEFFDGSCNNLISLLECCWFSIMSKCSTTYKQYQL